MNCSVIGASAFAVAGMAVVAAAEPTVVFSDAAGTTNGGSFVAATSDHGTFITFCLEYEEDLDINGGTTYEYVISTEAKFNGNGSVDPLDARSAFLFQNFNDGEIRNILGDQGLSDDEVANAMQIALWDIEEEIADFSGHPDYSNAQALITAAQSAIDGGSWSGLGNVRVMQIWDVGQIGEEDGAHQDTLIIVPLPSGFALAGLGLFGVAGVCRRHR